MDRRIAPLAVEPVPESQLLLAMGSIECIVDIKRDGVRRRGMAGAVDIHHLATQPDQRADIGRVLPPRQGRLARKPDSLARCLANRHHEGRIVPKGIQIVGIFVSTRNRQHARAQNV